jgi:hypothetical protein
VYIRSKTVSRVLLSNILCSAKYLSSLGRKKLSVEDLKASAAAADDVDAEE